MAYYPSSTTVLHFHNNDGTLLNGGYILAKLAGTDTATPFYLNEAGDELGTQVDLNARGEPEYNGDTVILYLDTAINYKFELYDSNDNLIWPVDDLNAAQIDSPLIIQDTDYAEIQLINDSQNGVSMGYRNSTGLLEVAQVVAGVTEDVCVQIDPTPSDTVQLSSVDPFVIQSDDYIEITAGDTLDITAADILTLSGASDIVITAAGDLTITATGLLKLGAALGDAVEIAGFTMPTADGANGAALITNGAGELSFSPTLAPAADQLPSAWCRFVGSDGTLTASFNVNNVVRTGTGQWTIFFDNELDNLEYIILATSQAGGGQSNFAQAGDVTAADQCTVQCKDTAASFETPAYMNVVVYGGR